MASSHPIERRTFPPFPKPSPSVRLLSFAEFDEREWGIRAYNEDDSIEVDAQGVETVPLSSTHNMDRCKSNRKQKQYFQALRPDDTPVPQEETNKVRLDWWDVWLTDSHTKFANVDPKLPLEDKIAQASDQFHKWRKLGTNTDPHSHSYIWDKFRFYAGLLSQEKKSDVPKKVEAAYDDDDDVVPAIEEIQPEAPENEKLSLFARNIELSIQIFLSSWLQDNGQHVWAGNLKTYPWIVYFFLDFLKRSRILQEKEEEDLDRALKFIVQAKRELPLTHSIAQIAPDNWSLALEYLWGSKIPPFKWIEHEGGIKDSMNAIWESGKKGEEKKEEEAREADDDQTPSTTEPSGWGDGAQAPQEDGWGNSNGWGDGNGGEGGWGAGETNPAPEDAPDHTGWEIERPSILRWLGPTALPNTHTTGIVEQSVRRIVKVIPAGQDINAGKVHGAGAVEQQLENHFTRIVLTPWFTDRNVTPPGESLMLPEIKSTSTGPTVNEDGMDVDAVSAHDPFKDDIQLLVEPEHTELFQKAVGMGLKSIWIQIARVEDVDAGRVRGADEPFYAYAEQLTNIFPSFYLTRAETVGKMKLVG